VPAAQRGTTRGTTANARPAGLFAEDKRTRDETEGNVTWEGNDSDAATIHTHAIADPVEMQFIHTADWWGTFCALAGVEPTDRKAASNDPPLPAIDSVNVWPMIAGINRTSARQSFPLGGGSDSQTRGFIQGRWKLVVGHTAGVGMSGYTGTYIESCIHWCGHERVYRYIHRVLHTLVWA
jgi:hypothetical protein